jgi:hypothetical protein
MKKSLLIGFCMFSASACVYFGCTGQSLTADWEEAKVDGPWIGNGIQAREYIKSYFAHVMDAGVTEKKEWRSPDGTRINADGVFRSIDQYLQKSGLLEKWPGSGAYSDNREHRLAPFTFHLISVNPTIVVLAPHDFGTEKNRSVSGTVGFAPKQFQVSDFVTNHFEYGTKVPLHADLLWFSPESKTLPQPCSKLTDGSLLISYGKTKLLLKNAAGHWASTRE